MLRLSCFFLIILMAACRPEVRTPKPRGYFRIELPQRSYQQFSAPGFPYSFEYPAYSRVVKDTLFFGQKPENPFWMNLDFQSLGASLYISYKPITAAFPLAKLIEDAHEMSFNAHSKRADYIDEKVFTDPQHNVFGILYHAGGNAASAYQFIATDSAKHFIRGALYFDVSPNSDSLLPINSFLKEDVQHLLQTLHWNN